MLRIMSAILERDSFSATTSTYASILCNEIKISIWLVSKLLPRKANPKVRRQTETIILCIFSDVNR